MPLKSALNRSGITALAVVHTNKHLRRGQSALDVIPGRRGDLAGLAKAVLVVARSADDPDTTRLVGVAKWNHGIPQPSLSFAVESVDVPPSDLHDEVIEEVPLLRPLGTVPMDAATILRQAAELAEPDEEEKATARSQAWAALVAILKDGKEHRVRDLQEALPDHDWSTVKRAARDNGVESKPDPTHTGRGRANTRAAASWATMPASRIA